MQHQFFQGFIPQQEMMNKTSNITPALQHNQMVFEIYNNWPNVKVLVAKAQGEQEIEVDSMERDWLMFLNKNKIDIISFKSEEEFVDKHLKPLAKNEK